MKRLPVLALAAVLLLSGCGNMFEDSYHYAAPFTYNVDGESGDAIEISNYSMLKSALIDMVSRRAEEAVFRFSRYNGSVADDLASACMEIRTANPLGAYAVESMSYDTSRIVSYYLAELRVSYRRSAEEVGQVTWITSLPELDGLIRDCVSDYGGRLVLRIYSEQVDEDYIASRVEAMHLSDPVTVVVEPETEITSYPNEGPNRIYDVSFRYHTNSQRLRTMSRRLSEQISAMADAIDAEDDPHAALDAAEALYSRLRETDGSGRTAYAAIVSRSADSKGIALAYGAVCGALGLECIPVRGQALGEMGAEEHWWNILRLEGAYYHVDVSRFGEGRVRAFLLDDAELWGEYLWDTELYPECAGALRYADLVPLPLIGPVLPPHRQEGQAEPPAATDAPTPPEATEPPAETDTPEKPEETQPPAETDAPAKPEETKPPAGTGAAPPPEETDSPQEDGKAEPNAPEETEKPKGNKDAGDRAP